MLVKEVVTALCGEGENCCVRSTAIPISIKKVISLVMAEIQKRNSIYLNYHGKTREYCFAPKSGSYSPLISYLFPENVLKLIQDQSKSAGTSLTISHQYDDTSGSRERILMYVQVSKTKG